LEHRSQQTYTLKKRIKKKTVHVRRKNEEEQGGELEDGEESDEEQYNAEERHCKVSSHSEQLGFGDEDLMLARDQLQLHDFCEEDHQEVCWQS
jgi:hypothetical protein